MTRQARSLLPDGMFHVTARTASGQALFFDDGDRRVFLWQLRRLTQRFGVELLAYCLMGTHHHLLLSGASKNLPAVMGRLNGGYAQHFSSRHTRHGHVFGDRYTARPVRDERHLEELWRYIEANPAKAGLSRPGQTWRWMWLKPLAASSGQAGGLSH